MAISARTAALLEQRRSSRGYSSNKIRILSPSKTSGINFIAKRAVQDQLSAMITQYNDGLIGNEEMLSFLQKNANNPGLTVQDKAELNSQINDFTVRIQKDRLEAVYKNAPEGSLEQIQAAEALTNFYNDRASKMQPGTPAQSQALENAGVWNQRISDMKLKGARADQKTLETQYRQNINTLPTSSSQRSKAEADMYQKLYDLAVSQGDNDSANQYAAAYNQAQTVADQYVKSEAEQEKKTISVEQRKSFVDQLNGLVNDYQDGKIDLNTYRASLDQAEQAAVDIGDSTLSLRVNSLRDKADKEIKKLASAPEDLSAWDKEDYDYTSQKKKAIDSLKSGELTPENFSVLMSEVIGKRFEALNNRQTQIEGKVGEDVNARVRVSGRSARAEDLLNDIYKELDSVRGQYDALKTGNFALAVVPPKEFNKSGTLSNGKSISDVQIVDKRNIPSDYQPDDQGFYNYVDQRKILDTSALSPDGKTYKDPNTGNIYPVSQDENGNFTYNVADVYELGTANRVSAPFEPGKKISSWKTINQPKIETQTPIVTPQKTQLSLPSVPQSVKNIATGAANVVGDIAKATPFIQPITTAIQTGQKVVPEIQKLNFQAPKVQVPSVQSLATNVLPDVSKALPFVGPAVQGISSLSNLASQAPKVAPQITKSVNNTVQNITNTLGSKINEGVNWLKNIKLPQLPKLW